MLSNHEKFISKCSPSALGALGNVSFTQLTEIEEEQLIYQVLAQFEGFNSIPFVKQETPLHEQDELSGPELFSGTRTPMEYNKGVPKPKSNSRLSQFTDSIMSETTTEGFKSISKRHAADFAWLAATAAASATTVGWGLLMEAFEPMHFGQI